jgi:hypothetical protein
MLPCKSPRNSTFKPGLSPAFCAVTLIGLALTGATGATVQLSLPEQSFDRQQWKLVGTNPEAHVHPASDHVEISIGADDSTQSVGFGPSAMLRGDFEIRAEYDVELLARPTKGFGCGPSIYLTTRSPRKNAATIGRLNRIKEGESFSAYWGETVNEQRVHHPQLKPAVGGKGVLALKRSEKTLEYLVGDTWDGPMQSIRSVEFGGEDVNYVRIGVDRGGDQQPVRVRWRHVRIVTGTNASAPDRNVPVLARIQISGNTIILGILLATGISLSIIWWLVRGRRIP